MIKNSHYFMTVSVERGPKLSVDTEITLFYLLSERMFRPHDLNFYNVFREPPKHKKNITFFRLFPLIVNTFYQQKHKPFSNKFAKYTFIYDTTKSYSINKQKE